jgi:hypothetical protein
LNLKKCPFRCSYSITISTYLLAKQKNQELGRRKTREEKEEKEQIE